MCCTASNSSHIPLRTFFAYRATSRIGSLSELQLRDEEIDDDDDDDIVEYDPKLNCNKIRAKIQQLIDSGEYRVTHFQRELNVASNSYGHFMNLKGPWNGIDNQT